MKEAIDKYDGHSPKTCNWRQCLAGVDTPCPFTKEQGAPKTQTRSCSHEWRQLVGADLDFYCIHCLEITTPQKYQDGIICGSAPVSSGLREHLTRHYLPDA